MNINFYDYVRGIQMGFVRYDDGYVFILISLRSVYLVG